MIEKVRSIAIGISLLQEAVEMQWIAAAYSGRPTGRQGGVYPCGLQPPNERHMNARQSPASGHRIMSLIPEFSDHSATLPTF
jgi:hypothetical protein